MNDRRSACAATRAVLFALLTCALLLVEGAVCAAQSSQVTLASLLKEMSDPAALAHWPSPEFTSGFVSSHDHEKKSPDQPGWFANHDFSQYIRTEQNAGRQEQVMMDADGPGAIVRFWLTAGSPKNGVLRVYLDGADAPAMTFKGFDLLQGGLDIPKPLLQAHPGYGPDSGGANLYLPIPYAKHCKVTWEEGPRENARYYQIDYRTYAPETDVETFSLDQLTTERELITHTAEQLLSPPSPSGKANGGSITLTTGGKAVLALPSGPMAVQELSLKIQTSDPATAEQALRSIILQVAFDNDVTIWCPVTDFFGSGVGINEVRNFYQIVNKDGLMRCRWVMPYEKNAIITLLNLGRQPVTAQLSATTGPWQWDARSMHFYTAWHYESGLKTDPPRDWNFIEINGRGIWVGDSLALFNPVATWYGEGDEKIRVDEENYPAHIGTGMEDYFSYSHAPKGIIQTPFSNQVRIDEEHAQGNNVEIRNRPLDGILFEKSFRFDWELISWKPTSLTYAATAHWYAFPSATFNGTPQPVEAALPVPTLRQADAARPRFPGALECETMKIFKKSGTFPVSAQDMSPWDSRLWSGGEQLLVQPDKDGESIELEIPAPDASPRQLILHATQAPDYAIIKFTVNDKPVAASFDGFDSKVQPSDPIKLGVFSPINGRYVLKVEGIGANPAATGSRTLFGLDCVVLEIP